MNTLNVVVGILLLSVTATPLLTAQVTCGAPATTVLQENTAIAVPSDKAFDKVGVFNVPTGRLTVELGGPISGGQWTPSGNDIVQLSKLDPADNKIVWFVSGNQSDLSCLQEINVDVDSDSGPGAPAAVAPEETGLPSDWQTCINEGEKWRNQVMESRKHDKQAFTMIVFYENQEPCYSSRDYGVVGDPIYVGVFTDGGTRWGAATYEPCEIEPAGVRLYIAPGGFPNVREARRKVRHLERRAPRTCYNTALQVGIKGRQAGTAVETRMQIGQSQRYHGTLQLGVVFTEQHGREFGLRPQGAESVIFDKGPADEGPEYTASVAIYSLPKSLLSLARGRFPGRDIVHDQGILDRIGGVVGVGLSDPGERFIAGLSFELLYGVNLTYVQDFARVRRLAGVSEGQAFAGTEDEIPTREEWRNHSYVGLGLDLRYVAAIFSRQ